MSRHRPEPPPGKSWCSSCRRFKALDAFYRLRTGPQGRYPQCKKCYREHFESKREQIQASRRRWEQRLKYEAIHRYGGECACCGERTLEFLTVVPFSRKKPRGNLAYRLRRQNYPKGFRVLCANCNTACLLYGACPHENFIILG